jgi:hypothetical protein
MRRRGRAPDRYEAVADRELGPRASPILAAAPAARHPLALGLAAFERWFDTRPVALVNPGDEWTDGVLERALALELELVSSYYLALRDGERFCWAQHVCAPYLDLPDAAWFEAELPVAATFHDRDLALHGVGWVEDWLERWEAAGARRLVDLRELAAALRLRPRLVADGARLELRTAPTGALLHGRADQLCSGNAAAGTSRSARRAAARSFRSGAGPGLGRVLPSASPPRRACRVRSARWEQVAEEGGERRRRLVRVHADHRPMPVRIPATLARPSPRPAATW